MPIAPFLSLRLAIKRRFSFSFGKVIKLYSFQFVSVIIEKWRKRRNFFPIGQTTFEVNCRRVVQKKRSTVATYINKIKLLLTIETNALPQRKRKKYCLSPTKHETPMNPPPAPSAHLHPRITRYACAVSTQLFSESDWTSSNCPRPTLQTPLSVANNQVACRNM